MSKYKPVYNQAEQEFLGSLRALLKRYGCRLVSRETALGTTHYEVIRLPGKDKECIYLSLQNLIDEVGEEIWEEKEI